MLSHTGRSVTRTYFEARTKSNLKQNNLEREGKIERGREEASEKYIKRRNVQRKEIS